MEAPASHHLGSGGVEGPRGQEPAVRREVAVSAVRQEALEGVADDESAYLARARVPSSSYVS
jgi:hypothetical protein